MAKAKLTAEEQQEIEQLKARLTRMGEKFSPNIGLEALRNKVNGLLGDSDEDLDEGDEPDLDDGLVDLDDDETEDTLLDDDELEDWEPVPTKEIAGGEIDLTAELANIDFELDTPKRS